MLTISRTQSHNIHFIQLVNELDAYLSDIDGTNHSFYAQFNRLTFIQSVVVIYEDSKPVGCGALKKISPGRAEIKRMYTTPASRRKGIAKTILVELEQWAKELGYTTCVLETGKRMTDAVALYTACGYSPTPNYGQYIGVETSVCFEKKLV